GCLPGRQDTIEQFITQAKTALASVGVCEDTIHGDGKDDIERFLNRILGIAPVTQYRIFGSFMNILNDLLRKARNEGNLDTGIVDLEATDIKAEKKTIVYVDPDCGASTFLSTFTLDHRVSWELANTMLNKKEQNPGSNDGFYRSNNSEECLGEPHVILALG
ncbi:strawberry notch-like protein, partial [Trifolium medium]|nr:strawberry notch-like protein [Trifolium medium]